ncbi:calcium binding egf domain-containing protein [Besnoitia besnoiti]|uniref:Calcium binding egf domain-containing protein n=1 Tax=Besnoitia besnoiti TaxID=94643 RepID=A0A2A9ME79_BESBE|nr:calcium binding egf domain-containing protein [Besnoitia besnoiti]PFH33692.1 calcium binding egf domain-containing protein [Besnoitia besnoiti]
MKERLLLGSACSQSGTQFCAKQPHATLCVIDGNDFRCSCVRGYDPVGVNASSACVDIDECVSGRHECPAKLANSVCVNTEGSYDCICDQHRRLSGTVCEDINECIDKTDNCGRFTECINRDGEPPLCKCIDGYAGNDDQPGTDCTDVDECSQEGAESLCPDNADCIKTVGSYRCECHPGYQMADDNICEQVDLCGTGQHNCDRYLAECIQTGGTVTCRCKDFFIGSGETHDCVALSGYEHLACYLLNEKCSSYEQCVRSTSTRKYGCEDKGLTDQLGVFFSQGGTADTPFWIWVVVTLGVFFIGFAIWIFVGRMIRKKEKSDEDQAVAVDNVYAYGYGAMEYYS